MVGVPPTCDGFWVLPPGFTAPGFTVRVVSSELHAVRAVFVLYPSRPGVR